MSESNVQKLEVVSVGDGYRFDADRILEEAKGREFAKVVVIGELPDGEIWISGSANAGESLILMKWAERRVVFGE